MLAPANCHLDVRVHLLHRFGDVIVLRPVLVQRHAAVLPGTVHFIADGPEPDVEWLGITVLRPHFTQACVVGTIAVFHLLGRDASLSESAVDRKIGFRSEQSTEGDEFMQTDLVGLHPRAPHRLKARRALIPIAKTVVPVIARHEVAAGATWPS